MLFNYKNQIYIDEELYYTFFRIKNRLIFSPCTALKKKQKRFLNAIKWVYKLNINAYEAARIHVDNKWILKMDIKDFYGSIKSNDIKRFVSGVCERIKLADTHYYYHLLTVEDKLPQGAPTSAHIANACFEKINHRIKFLCKSYDVNYSRYMDDLTFSCNSKEVLNLIENKVEQILLLNGYKLNPKKTKYISDNKRQDVLGIVVNGKKARLSNDFKRQIRAMIYNYAKQKNNKSRYCVNENQLLGYLAYVKSVDKEFYNRLNLYMQKLNISFFHNS